jgi:hypothetical protein
MPVFELLCDPYLNVLRRSFAWVPKMATKHMCYGHWRTYQVFKAWAHNKLKHFTLFEFAMIAVAGVLCRRSHLLRRGPTNRLMDFILYSFVNMTINPSMNYGMKCAKLSCQGTAEQAYTDPKHMFFSRFLQFQLGTSPWDLAGVPASAAPSPGTCPRCPDGKSAPGCG